MFGQSPRVLIALAVVAILAATHAGVAAKAYEAGSVREAARWQAQEIERQQQAAKQAQAEELSNRLAQNQARTDARLKESDAALNARLEQMEKRLAEVARMAEDALAALGLGPRKIYGKVVHSVALTDAETLFPINSPELGNADMAKLDALAAKVKALGTHYHLQIQGHTNGFGSEDYNYDLGRARAEVVKNYLNEKGGIPILRMSVISYGAKEAASYTGKSNRRIVVNVLQ